MEITANTQSTAAPVATQTEPKSLREHVQEALGRYFSHFNETDGAELAGVRSFVLEEVESALYFEVMRFTRGNQSRAALLTGVSRGTLRTKLKYYFGTTHVGLENGEIPKDDNQ